jgi:hypothetical protein
VRLSRLTVLSMTGIATILGSAGALMASSAGPGASPPQPPWINADGTVNPTKAPATIGVLGVDGKPLLDANGREVRVPFSPSVNGYSPVQAQKAADETQRLQTEDALRKGLTPPTPAKVVETEVPSGP